MLFKVKAVKSSIVIAYCLTVLFCSCSKNSSERDTRSFDTVRVMSFNILYGGDEINFSKIIEAIQVADADVVGIQEAEGAIPKLAHSLGWKYFDSRLHILSKYPLISDSINGWYYSLVEIKPGKVIALSNIHLPSDPYGPELVRDGHSIDSVLANEYALRYTELNEHRKILPSLAKMGIPVFLTGDFNSPSHLDWTTTTLNSRFHLKYPVVWPVSKNLEQLGFIDTYRSVYPDPIKKPGLTWTPGYPPPYKKENETHDRIDFVWATGVEKILRSQIVGELDGPDVDIGVTPFATDHRGVVSTCLVKAAVTPEFVQAYPVISFVKDSITIEYNSGTEKKLHLEIRDSGNVLIQPISNIQTGRSQISILVPSNHTGKHYLLLKNDKEKIIARNVFWKKQFDDKPQLLIDKSGFASGESIPIEWKNSLGNRFDWIAIYPQDAHLESDYGQTHQDSQYLIYQYTKGQMDGKMELNGESKGDFWPLKPGHYTIHLLLDDGFVSLASTPIQIVSKH